MEKLNIQNQGFQKCLSNYLDKIKHYNLNYISEDALNNISNKDFDNIYDTIFSSSKEEINLLYDSKAFYLFIDDYKKMFLSSFKRSLIKVKKDKDRKKYFLLKEKERIAKQKAKQKAAAKKAELLAKEAAKKEKKKAELLKSLRLTPEQKAI